MDYMEVLYKCGVGCLILFMLFLLLKWIIQCAKSERNKCYVDYEADRALNDSRISTVHIEAGDVKKIYHKHAKRLPQQGTVPTDLQQHQREGDAKPKTR